MSETADATVTLSIDLELGWGLRDLPEQRRSVLSADGTRERAYLGRLLALCDRLSIPLTFATVGRLVDADGLVTERFGHPPDDRLIAGARSRPLFRAPELLERIRGRRVDHEIGTHTFSHVICDELSDRILDREFRSVAALHDRLGLDRPTSFVAPRNRLPASDVPARHGLTTVRVAESAPSAATAGQLVNVARSRLRATDPLVAPASRTGPVTELRSTPFPSLTALYLPTGRAPAPTPFRQVPTGVRKRAHAAVLRRKLDEVCQTGGDLHLWSHLFNLANPAQYEPVSEFLLELAERRDDGALTVLTMGEQA